MTLRSLKLILYLVTPILHQATHIVDGYLLSEIFIEFFFLYFHIFELMFWRCLDVYFNYLHCTLSFSITIRQLRNKDS